MKYLRWFRKASAPFRWQLTGAIICHLILTACSLGYVYVSKALIDTATGHASGTEGMGVKEMLILLGAVMIGIIILRDGARALKTYLQTKVSVKMENALRQRHFDSLLRIDGDVRGRFHSGDIINRLESDVNVVSRVSCNTIPNLVGTAVQFAAAFIYLVILEAKLAWILVIILPAGILGGKFIMHRIRTLTLQVRKNDSEVQSHIQESIQHQTLIKTMEYDSVSSSSLEGLQDSLYENTMKRTRFALAARIIVSLTMAISYAMAFLWGVFGIYEGTITYGLMTAFLQLVGQLQRPLAQMGEELPSIFHSTASIDRLDELDSMPLEPVCEPVLFPGKCGIRLDDVSFRYEDGKRDILHGMSHDFTPGSRTAIVGRTGAGKSTTIKLMLALLKPGRGTISIYDENSSAAVSPATRCNLVYVPQGNSLFSGSIRDNLLMGDPHADGKKIEQALFTAAAEFVYDLPDGLDTQCFEAGGGLSEGQAQRIAIARALLRPGNILLLDEFSSALDPATEATLITRLMENFTDKTMIFITHREKIASYCSETLKIEK